MSAIKRWPTSDSVAIDDSEIIRDPSDLSNEWLSDVIKASVTGFTTQRIGTGQVSITYRVSLQYSPYDQTDPPSSVIMKVASTDRTSRQSSSLLGLYERESRFYAEVATRIEDAPLAQCYYTAYHEEDGTFCLILDDDAPAVVGNEIEGATLERAKLAMYELARLHAASFEDDDIADMAWLNRIHDLDQTRFSWMFRDFVQRYNDRVKTEHLAVAKRLVESFDLWLGLQEEQGSSILGLMHGDYRLDHLLFGEEGAKRKFTVVNWQTVSWGHVINDVAYFLGGALTTENRRAWSEELLKVYHEGLGPNPPLSMKQLQEGVRGHTFFGIVMSIVSPIFVERTTRGDDMFTALFARHCEHAIDLDSVTLLPQPAIQRPLRPEAEDEESHQPGPEPLWQESWHMDFASIDHGIGGYIRAGVDPSRNRTWYTALFCGPDRPTVALVDFQAPLPSSDMTITTSSYTATQAVESPLESFRVTLHGTAQLFPSPSALLEPDARGAPVPIELDLRWSTDGVPYRYRITTRYEIACRVSGSLRLGDETFALDAVPGQRDHSWGSRDWWSMDWVWSALHLRDGTHIHGLDLRVPDRPKMFIGYTQARGQGVTHEVTVNDAEEEFGADGLARWVRWRIEPGKLEVEMEILGQAPLRLVADDGRVGMFPRAWGRVKTKDGREGVGWAEWMRNKY